MDNLEIPIRQISDYSLDELNKHISIIRQIPNYIMLEIQQQYWIDKIKMFKNIILDNMEQKTCMFDRHTKIQKYLNGRDPYWTFDNNYVYYNDNRNHKKFTYNDFYIEYREEIETYFMNMSEKTGVVTPGLNSEIEIETNVLQKFQKDEKRLLEED